MKKIKSKIVTVIALLFFTLAMQAQQVQITTSDKVESLLKSNPKTIILDVRTAGEFLQGHIKGATLIDVNQADSYSKYDKLDKSKTYLVYCRTKNRSGVVSNYLLSKGFKNIIQMYDGIVGWTANNLPLQK